MERISNSSQTLKIIRYRIGNGKCEHIDPGDAGGAKHAGTGGERRARRQDIIDQDDIAPVKTPLPRVGHPEGAAR